MKQGQNEFRLQCAVSDYLRQFARLDVYWTALPFGEARPKRKNAKGEWYSPTGLRLQRMGVRNGAPDYFFIVAGVPIGLELKLATDKRFGTTKTYQTKEQKATEALWEKASGIYELAHGYDEAIAILERWGIVSPNEPNRSVASENRVAA